MDSTEHPPRGTREGAQHPFRDVLIAEHDQLDAALAHVFVLADRGAREQLVLAWDAFEADLLAHMEAEEIHLLPALAGHAPARALAIAEEHARIRVFVAELDMATADLRAPLESIRSLALALRAHAEFEVEALYEWADEWLDERVLHALCHAAPPVLAQHVHATGFSDAEPVDPESGTYRAA